MENIKYKNSCKSFWFYYLEKDLLDLLFRLSVEKRL